MVWFIVIGPFLIQSYAALLRIQEKKREWIVRKDNAEISDVFAWLWLMAGALKQALRGLSFAFGQSYKPSSRISCCTNLLIPM